MRKLEYSFHPAQRERDCYQRRIVGEGEGVEEGNCRLANRYNSNEAVKRTYRTLTQIEESNGFDKME